MTSQSHPILDRRQMIAGLLASSAAGLMGACQVNVGNTSINAASLINTAQSASQLASLGEDDEIRIGERLYGQMIDTQGGAYRNRKVQAAMDRFADPIIRSSTRTTMPWEVTVIDDNSVNAWALPGGKLGINKGLLRYVANEDELAAVVAHEVGHIQHAHTLSEMRGERGLEMLKDIGVTAASTQSGTAGFMTRTMIDNFAPHIIDLALTGYSRGNEFEADAFILTSFSKTGHDPRRAPDFFRTLLELIPPSADNIGTTSLFSTHPATRERIAALEEKGGAKSGTARNPGFADLRRTFPYRQNYLRNRSSRSS